MSADGWAQTETIKWVRDPRSEVTDAGLKAQFELAVKIRDRVSELHEALAKIRDVKKKLEDLKTQNAGLATGADALAAKLTPIEEDIYQTKNRSGQDPLNYPIRLNNRMAALLPVVLTGDFAPTKPSYDVFAGLSAEADAVMKRLKAVWDKDLVAFNEELKKANLAPIVPEPTGLSQAGSGG